MEKKYRYLGYSLFLLIPLTFLGFFKTYFVQFFNFNENIDSFVHLHALIASIWIIILIAQPILILNKKNKVHKRIGKISYIVFPLLILSFVPQMIKIANSENVKNLFYPLADCILLIIFYSLAIYNRKTAPKHMRYMIAIALVFLGPTIGRINRILLGLSDLIGQNILYGIIYLILVTLVFYDKANKRSFKPYLFVLICYLGHQAIFHVVFI